MSTEQKTVGNMVDGAPWWLKAGLVVYTTVGLPTALIVYDKLQEAGVVPNPIEARMESVEGKLEEVTGLAVQSNAAINNVVEDLKKAEERRKMYCVLRAQNEAEKRACFPGSKE